MAVLISVIDYATLSGKSTPNISSILTIVYTASKESKPNSSNVAFLDILSALHLGIYLKKQLPFSIIHISFLQLHQ